MSDPIGTFVEGAVHNELKELVRKTVEDTLNAPLEKEADDLVGAKRYERTADRDAYRAGHYERGLTTTSGQVTPKMPKIEDTVRNSNHRALQEARDLYRGGDDRDAPGRCLLKTHRGCIRDTLGRERADSDSGESQ